MRENNNYNNYLLDVKGLKTYFYTPEGIAKATDNISFHVGNGESIGIVGESGCGKSVLALAILDLIPSPPGKIVDGEIYFKGEDLRKIALHRLRSIRGNRISMIFQEPMTSLNPVYTIGHQIVEIYMEHQGLPKKEAKERAIEMLAKVQIPSPSKRFYEYPHQLSGGMRQRAMIAMALSCNPELILADEPTTALDVTIQAQILELMAEQQELLKTSIIMITHDLGIVAEFAKRVIVMYSGRIVEEASVETIYETPLHPYTIGLLNSIPKLGQKAIGGKRRLNEIPGTVPSLIKRPEGCHFHPRCSKAREICRNDDPNLYQVQPKHLVACWKIIEGW